MVAVLLGCAGFAGAIEASRAEAQTRAAEPSPLAEMPNLPRAQQEAAIVHIIAMSASREDSGVDPRLRPIRSDLRSLPFRGYALIGARACTLRDGDRCGMKIEDEGYLQLRTTETTPQFLKLHLLLNRRNRPVVNADLKLNRDAGVLLTSSRVDGRTLVLSIKLREYPGPDNHGPDAQAAR